MQGRESMPWRIVGLISYPIFAAIVGVTSTMVLSTMVDEVNRHRSAEERISTFGWDPGKLVRVVNLYRDAYPNGRRHIQLAILLGTGVAGFLIASVCLFAPS